MVRAIPSRPAIVAIATVAGVLLVARLGGVSAARIDGIAVMLAVLGAAVAIVDLVSSRRAWRTAPPRLTRRLPAAFAIGVPRTVGIVVDAGERVSWRCTLYDHADPTLAAEGLPTPALTFTAGKRIETSYSATPTVRGEVAFRPADVRVRSRSGCWDLLERLGGPEQRRVYPDFAQVARYAWLAGDRRLDEIGIKTFQQRGTGTDFKQLAEYRIGDSVRHIDWRATLRVSKPIVREFQDERDQCVLLLVDCGRRMRADDPGARTGSTHFDQVLNAVMLVTYVALRQGDAVGAMTFGTPPGAARAVPPRKGLHALNAMMAQLYGIQPTPTHSDYLAAAQELSRHQRKRALVIVVTNFRNEDSVELQQALRLLRARHLVLLASLRERVVDELAAQPLGSADGPIDVASALLYEQQRRDAFNRLSGRDRLMVDALPERLGVELVNRYRAIKRAGLI